MPDPAVARLEQAAEKATPGPWRLWHGDDSYAMNCFAVVTGEPDGTEYIDEKDLHRRVVAITLLQQPRYATHESGRWQEDAEFIAAASPDVVAGLCARVRELETLIEDCCPFITSTVVPVREASHLLKTWSGAEEDWPNVVDKLDNAGDDLTAVADDFAAALVVSRPGEDTP